MSKFSKEIKELPDFENRTLEQQEEYRISLIESLICNHLNEYEKEYESCFLECKKKFNFLQNMKLSDKQILHLIYFALTRRIENE